MTNKTVLITGAASGIGAGLALAFGRAGYNVAVNFRSVDSLPQAVELAAKIETLGIKSKSFMGDVSNYNDCKEMVQQVTNTFGSLEVLINNAGITRDGLLPRMKEENFDDVIAANLKSVFNMCRLVTPIMMKQRKGWIINMASVVGIYGNAAQTNYAASKAGIIGFTKSLAKELGGRGILCNAIAPGFVQSPMTDILPDSVKEKILSGISLKRFGQVEDIEKAALFLADTTYITGHVLVVDGGLSM